jgi:hypothetical protein
MFKFILQQYTINIYLNLNEMLALVEAELYDPLQEVGMPLLRGQLFLVLWAQSRGEEVRVS